jgi:hydroxyacylglutathione hydrolase
MLLSTPKSVAEVYAVPMLQDNYGFILVDRVTGKALIVDPSEGEPALNAVKEGGFQLEAVLTTHKHWDHVGGNKFLHEAIPSLEFIATKHEAVPCATKLVGDGETFQFGSLTVTAFNTFCHTSGHVSYFVEDKSSTEKDPILFCGDTLFIGGCGKFFEGTAQQMLENMDIFGSLPGNTQVFCAHEYTENNFRFLTSIDPETCEEKYQHIRHIRAQGKPTIPSSISEELKYNLFMNCHSKRVQEMLGVSSAVEAMNELRTRKNNF